MTAATTRRILALGAISGMRSMAGAAALGARHGGTMQAATAMLAAAEMVADKTPYVGNRTDPLPQAGRAVMGAIVGGVIAAEHGESPWLGAFVGAAAAVVATHLAYRLRARLPLSIPVGGLLEDAVVVGAGALYVRRSRTAR